MAIGSKITELTANTAPLDTDLSVIVDDPSGTELTQKITLAYLRQIMTAFAQSATVTVANLDSETTLIGAGLGSATLIAAYFNVAGRALKVKAWGVLSNTGTPTLNIKVKAGSTVLAATGDVTLAADQTNAQWELECDIVCRSTGAAGTVIAQGRLRVDDVFYPMVNTAVSGAIDLTAAIVVGVTAEWSAAAAGNTISAHIVNFHKEN
jgi:hypothetical protein